MRFLSLATIFGVFFFLVIACKPGAEPGKPPTIRYGEDSCDECRMIINEARYAAAYVTENGLARRFDDIGCLLQHHQQQREKVANFWVNDYDTREWLNAQKAYFADSDNLSTPMAYGIIAVSSQKRAEEILTEAQSGSVKEFNNLIEMND